MVRLGDGIMLAEERLIVTCLSAAQGITENPLHLGQYDHASQYNAVHDTRR
jgi:hypothetical protein